MDIEFSGYVERIIQANLGQTALTIERFSTGLSHFVFDVGTQAHSRYVVRLARPERRTEFVQGLYWHKRLSALDIPLPELYATGEMDGYAYAIYERLPGTDLELIYPSLSITAKHRLACAVANIQQRIGLLHDPQLYTVGPWVNMVQLILDRSEREIIGGGLGHERYVQLARTRVANYATYFAALQPVAFSYDHNIRNIIVDEEHVSGIIDVDELWLGDPLLTIGRGKTLLVLMGQDTDYITAWCDYLKLDAYQRQVVDLYALVYCVRFMGTLGQRLNGNVNPQTDRSQAHRLERLAVDLAERV